MKKAFRVSVLLLLVMAGACDRIAEFIPEEQISGPEQGIPDYDTNTQLLTTMRQLSSFTGSGSITYTFTFSDSSTQCVTYQLYQSNSYQVISRKPIIQITQEALSDSSSNASVLHELLIGSISAGTLSGTHSGYKSTVWNATHYIWNQIPGITALCADFPGDWRAVLKIYYTDGSTEELALSGRFQENIRQIARTDILAIELLERDNVEVCRLYVNGYLFTLNKSAAQSFGTTANPGIVYGWVNNNSANATSDVVIGKDYTAWGSLWETFTESIKIARYPRTIEDNSSVDRIYMGAVPSNMDMQKPVLIFVPGRGADAPMWWSNPGEIHSDLQNNMYRYVFHSGYLAYYVTVGAKDTILNNGKRLAQQIEKIALLHPDRKIVVVAHSKGGLDTTAALFVNGADRFVSKVVTLGTPFEGSFLADLAYTAVGEFSPEERYPATWDMRPENTRKYWEYMRSIHGREIPGTVPFYCLYGNNRGPIGSRMNIYGNTQPPNDGVVTVESAMYLINRGLAQSLGLWDVDHSAINFGKTKTRNGGWGASWSYNPVWDKIRSVL